MLASLGLALLAGAGAQRLVSSLRERRLSLAVALLLPVIVLAEGAFTLDQPRVPRAPAAIAGLPSPQIHLPIGPDERLFQFWSVDGFPKIVNGVSTFSLPSVKRIRGAMQNFPIARRSTCCASSASGPWSCTPDPARCSCRPAPSRRARPTRRRPPSAR